MMQSILPFHHTPSYLPEDYLVSTANHEAYLWITENITTWHNGGLILWGEDGCGKTHLAHIHALHASASFITLKDAETMLAKTRQTPPMWILDDVDEQLAQDAAEDSLFHILNIIMQEQGRILLTARIPPAQWGITLKDLNSRVLALSQTHMLMPDDTLIRLLLLKLFSDRQLHVADGVVDFIATRIERNFTTIQQVVNTLDHASLREKRNISTPLAREVVNNLSASHF